MKNRFRKMWNWAEEHSEALIQVGVTMILVGSVGLYYVKKYEVTETESTGTFPFYVVVNSEKEAEELEKVLFYDVPIAVRKNQ